MANESYPDFVAARPTATEIQDTDALLLVRSGITYQVTPDLLPGRLLARARTAANLDYTNSSDTVINLATVEHDPAGAITTGASWQYEVQADGYIDVRVPLGLVRSQAAAWSDGAYVQIDLYKNGSAVDTLAFYQSPGTSSTSAWYPLQGGRAISVVAGDTISLKFSNQSGATRRLTNGCSVEIYRVG